MKIAIFPTLNEALELHRILISRFGGKGGVRDLGLLQSALGRPQSGYYSSLTLQAAALMQSLALNHSFVDGNKRIAFAMTLIFLRLNGVRIEVNADQGEEFLVDRVINQRVEISEIAAWLQAHSTLARKK